MAAGDHVLKPDSLPWEEMEQGERFASQRKRLAAALGATGLGCSIYRIPPGKTSFPIHRHHANHEALFILAGSGTLRLDDEQVQVEQGDYINLPAGGPAHQLVNSSQETLEYLCMSTVHSPEVVEYTDSNKVGIIVEGASGKSADRRMWKNFMADTDVTYYEGE